MIVPELSIRRGPVSVVAPALLTSAGEDFEFAIHFTSASPPDWLSKRNKQFFSKVDQLTISGELNGEFAFQCRDVFPPAGGT